MSEGLVKLGGFSTAVEAGHPLPLTFEAKALDPSFRWDDEDEGWGEQASGRHVCCEVIVR